MGTAPTISDVLRSLGERAPWQKAGSWDPVGLQLGDPTASAARTALCHEVTEETVRVLEVEPVDAVETFLREQMQQDFGVAFAAKFYAPVNEFPA